MSTTFIRIVLAICCLSLTTFAGIRYELPDFIQNSANAGFGIVNVEGDNYLAGSIRPDFSIMALELGVDINIFMSLGSQDNDRPNDFQTIVLRRAKYDHQNQYGFEYGHLKNVTLGQGLLMENMILWQAAPPCLVMTKQA